ncbi:uncharacterized protein C8Q71DRAFT_721312 [Rhodofomes roseus]|uniref:DUF6533 domain-containing protein n=1 Tax=Rhodofomes roseus TaxID=34475 RepID=A0ABQ8KR78_9APHY|nr:uncharacterized protein C8Q71DRAFT_721312 [Rhodofomes roseus]KAH9840857.1 hypothetical protein C8Q71DRAFT_721312 [Rhodofomes roseus]
MSATDIVENASYDMLVNCILSATAALHVYDRVLNLGQEIQFIWRRENAKVILPVLYVTMHASATVFLLLNVLPVTPNCQYSEYCAIRWKLITGPPYGCDLIVTCADVLARVAVIAVDLLVFCATWRVTGGMDEVRRRDQLTGKTQLSGLLLKDGALQFGALLIFNIVTGVFLIKSNSYLGTNFIILLDVVTIILLSRLLFRVSHLSFKGVLRHVENLHDGVASKSLDSDEDEDDNENDDRMDEVQASAWNEDTIELSTTCSIASQSSDPPQLQGNGVRDDGDITELESV